MAPRFKIEINRFIGQPEECEPSRHPPATRKKIQAFLDAGFVALGIKRERCEGRPVRDGMAFANAAERAFGSIFDGPTGDPALYVLTPFEDGRAVLTGWYERGERTSTDWLIAQGAPEAKSIAELLEVHRASVAKMEKKGHPVFTRFDREARIESVRQYYENPDV